MIGPGDRLAEEGGALVRSRTRIEPAVAIVLGSGLGEAAAAMEVEASFSFDELPGFPPPSVPGHAGRLELGTLAGVPCAAFLGRVHYYEGHEMDLVTLPVRLAAGLGARTLVVTAAVGALDPALRPGSLVVGVDHVSFLGVDPLRGWRDESGTPAFVDLSAAYPAGLVDLALAAAGEEQIDVARGVYASMPGPTYETPAELRFLRGAGADVVGMSVVPDVVSGVALGMRCLGLYCVTNVVGAGVAHEEVREVAAAFAGRLGAVLARVVPALGEERG